MIDVYGLAADVAAYLGVAARTYGHALIDSMGDEVADASADATVGIARRVLRRLAGNRPVVDSVADIVRTPDQPGAEENLRAALRRALSEDAGLAAELRTIVPQTGKTIVASGPRALAADTIIGVVSMGDNATNWR